MGPRKAIAFIQASVFHSATRVGHTETQEAVGSLCFSQADYSSPGLGTGVAEALTWYKATLVGSCGADRLLADPGATDLGLPPSATFLDSLALSICSL